MSVLTPLCAVTGCGRTARGGGRGWCVKHYTRWKRHGDPTRCLNRMDMDRAQRTLSRVIQLPNGCWLWCGPHNNKGYGVTKDAGRSVLAHRWVFEHFRGPIPEGMTLDHLCRVEVCVNPRHLDPVPHLENMRRSLSPSSVASREGRCAKGHPVTPQSGYRVVKNGREHYRCKVCTLEWQRRRYAERRAS